MLELTFLGTGNAFAPDRYWSSFLLNRRYLFDCSPVVLPHLKMLGLPLSEIRAVLISHFHGDHLLGLPFLLLEYAERTKRQDELAIVGPTGVKRAVETIMEQVYPGILTESEYGIRFVESVDGQPEQIDDLAILPVAVRHTPKMPCFGYRAALDGRSIAYTGDASMDPSLLRLAEGADVFVMDCSEPVTGNEKHLGLNDIRELRAQLDSRTTFILTHVEADMDVSDMPGVLLAHDLTTFIFP